MTLDQFIEQAKAKHAAMTLGEWHYTRHSPAGGATAARIRSGDRRGPMIPGFASPEYVYASDDTNDSTIEESRREQAEQCFADLEGVAYQHNTYPLLLRIVERMREGLECDCGGVCHGANADLDPESNWCGPCIMRRDVEAIVEGAGK